MPKKWVKHKERPHVMRPEIRARFEALMKPEPADTPVNPKWQLWRWDTLEDVSQELTIKPGTGFPNK